MKVKEENKIVPYGKKTLTKKTELTNLDIQDIFKMTPNQIFNIWKDNEYKVNKQVSLIENDILELKKRISKTKNYQKMQSMNKEISQKQNSIKILKSNFQTWTNDMQNNINKAVRIIFSKLVVGINNNEINRLVKEFGDVFSKNENANETVENILIKFVQGYKTIQNNKNTEVEILDENRDSIKPATKHIHQNNYQTPHNIMNLNNDRNDNVRYFGISIYYGSSGNTNKNKSNNFGDGLQSMLLNAVDTLSNVLYGTIQDTLDEMNKKK